MSVVIEGSETPTRTITAGFSTTDHTTGGRGILCGVSLVFVLPIVRHDPKGPGVAVIYRHNRIRSIWSSESQ